MNRSSLDTALVDHECTSAHLSRQVRGATSAMRVALAELASINEMQTKEDIMRIVKRARSALRRGLGA